MSRKNNNSLIKHIARVGMVILAALGITGGTNKLLPKANQIVADNEEKSDEDLVKELEEISTKDVPIKFEALDRNRMGKYFGMYYDEFMNQYPNIDELVNSGDPSVNNILIARYCYGLVKAYYADLSGKKLPFDENNFDINMFNTKIELLKTPHWVKRTGNGIFSVRDDGIRELLYEDTDPKVSAILREYQEIKETGDSSKRRYFVRLTYNTLSDEDKIGLDNYPSSWDIYNGTKEARDETKFYEYYNNKFNNERNNGELGIESDNGYRLRKNGSDNVTVERDDGYKFNIDFSKSDDER